MVIKKDSILCFVFCAILIIAFDSVHSNESLPTAEHALKYPRVDKSLLLDIDKAGSTYVSAGERGHILWSNDGSTWTQAEVPTRSTLTAVTMVDEDHGWAVGHDAVILNTNDGGRTWQRQYYAPEEETPLLDVWFENISRGIAVGAYGMYLLTEDGGKTWEISKMRINRSSEMESTADASDELIDFYDLHLNAIAESADRILYIVAEAGKIYSSSDKGMTWNELPSPYVGSFFGVLPLENGALLVFGLRGNIYRTENDGRTWEKIDSNTHNIITNGIQLADGIILLTGLGGTLLVSHDQGHVFKLIAKKNRSGIASLIETDDGRIIVTGDNGINSFEPQNLELKND